MVLCACQTLEKEEERGSEGEEEEQEEEGDEKKKKQQEEEEAEGEEEYDEEFEEVTQLLWIKLNISLMGLDMELNRFSERPTPRRQTTSCRTSITARILEATATTTWMRLFTETPALHSCLWWFLAPLVPLVPLVQHRHRPADVF